MKKFSYALILSFFVFPCLLFSQNLVKIEDYSKNYSGEEKIVDLLSSSEDMLVFIRNEQQDLSIESLKNRGGTSDTNDVINYVVGDSLLYFLCLEDLVGSCQKLVLNKCNFYGDILWSKNITLNSTLKNFILCTDKEDNLYLQGSYFGDFIFETYNLSSVDTESVFLLKIKNTGELVGQKNLGLKKDLQIKDIKIRGNNIFMTGNFSGSFNEQIAQGNSDVFIAKYNISDLSFLKMFNFGSLYDDSGVLIDFYQNDDLVLVGNYEDSLRIGQKEIMYRGSKDVFICKMNKDLEVKFVNQFGTLGNDYVTDLVANRYGDLYVAGTYRTSIPGHEEKTDLFFNIYIIKLDSLGNTSFIHTINDSTTHYYNPQIEINSDNHIFVTANTTEPRAFANYFYEFYDCDYGTLIDLPEQLTFSEQTGLYTAPQGFSEYLWSTGVEGPKITFTKSGVYSLSVKDENGCISVDTTNVELQERGQTVNNITTPENNASRFTAKIYPNPTSRFLNINMNNVATKEPVRIIIANETGDVVFSKKMEIKVSSYSQKLKLELVNGTYIMKLINGENTQILKFIIVN